MKRFIIFVLLSLFFVIMHEARADKWKTAAYTGAVLDTASTIYALEQGAVEANPVLGENPDTETLLLFGALNVGLVYWVNETWHPRQAKKFNKFYSIIKLSVSTNNFIIGYNGEF